MTQPIKTVWIIVDKRGTFIESEQFRKTSLADGAGIPMFSFHKTRYYARFEINKIKKLMTNDAWKTWQLKPVRYNKTA